MMHVCRFYTITSNKLTYETKREGTNSNNCFEVFLCVSTSSTSSVSIHIGSSARSTSIGSLVRVVRKPRDGRTNVHGIPPTAALHHTMPAKYSPPPAVPLKRTTSPFAHVPQDEYLVCNAVSTVVWLGSCMDSSISSLSSWSAGLPETRPTVQSNVSACWSWCKWWQVTSARMERSYCTLFSVFDAYLLTMRCFLSCTKHERRN